jgi:hypothetical protein
MARGVSYQKKRKRPNRNIAAPDQPSS